MPDDTYEIGLIPGLGGPFNTATEYLRAWVADAAFPNNPEKAFTTQYGPFSVEIRKSVEDLPKRLSKMTGSVVFCHEGPFPLVPDEFDFHNILVDKKYEIVGVIDFEDAHTVP